MSTIAVITKPLHAKRSLTSADLLLPNFRLGYRDSDGGFHDLSTHPARRRSGTVLYYNPHHLSRGVEAIFTERKLMLRSLTPSPSEDIHLFYRLIRHACNFYGSKRFILDGRSVGLGSITKLCRDDCLNAAHSLRVFKIMVNHRIHHPDNNIGIPSLISTIILAPADIELIDGDLAKFSNLLHLRQHRKFIRFYPEFKVQPGPKPSAISSYDKPRKLSAKP